jgi:hypothetical protein
MARLADGQQVVECVSVAAVLNRLDVVDLLGYRAVA